MAKSMPGNTARSTLGKTRAGAITILRSPQVAHMRELADLQKFRQYRIKRK